MKQHTEARLEDAIIDHLTAQGSYVFVDYREGPAKDVKRAGGAHTVS